MSDSSDRALVQQWYQQYLGRQATQGEIDTWMQRHYDAKDPDMEGVRQAIAGSPEASSNTNPTIKKTGIQQAYNKYLYRDPSAAEYAYWQNQPDFEAGISNSPEANYVRETGFVNYQAPAGTTIGGTGGAGASGSTAGGGGGGPNAFRDAWLGSGGRTVADLKAFVAAHPEYGATLGGSKGDKVYGPGGVFWADAVLSAGTGGNGAAWLTDTGGGGGGDSSGTSFGQAPNSTPFNYAPFQAPDAFTFRAFEAPTALTEENDPGYQARLALGQQGVERSAAARGTLLTGGTLKDLNQFSQDYASNEFQNVYNRAQATYGTQYQQAAGDYNANYQNALNAYKTNFDTAFKPWDANYQQAYQSWLGNFNAANQGFQNNLAAQGQRYNELYQTAALGLNGVNNYSNAMQNYGRSLSDIYGSYGNQYGENLTNQGNANAASQMAQSNAYGNMYNQLGALALYGGSMYGNSPGGGNGSNGMDLYTQRFNNPNYPK
jgi:hypothetical protein